MDYVLTYCTLKTSRDSITSTVINKCILHYDIQYLVSPDIIVLDRASKQFPDK